jgi:NAD(P) transhydrogenase
VRFDMIVIGSGPAGRRAAIQAAKLDRSVLVVEERARVGGACVHTGTIPSKTLREIALNLTGWRERGFYGLTRHVKRDIDANDLAVRLEKTLNFEVGVLELQFARNGVKTARGKARFLDPHRIETRGEAGPPEVHEADHVLIAVGTRPYRPSHIPFDGERVLDSDGLARQQKAPRSLAVVGAGVIGIEYATIFSVLNVPVTIIEPRENFLEFIDREVIDHLVNDLRRRGGDLPARLFRGPCGDRRHGIADRAPERRAATCARACCCTRPAASARPTVWASRPAGCRRTPAAA